MLKVLSEKFHCLLVMSLYIIVIRFSESINCECVFLAENPTFSKRAMELLSILQ